MAKDEAAAKYFLNTDLMKTNWQAKDDWDKEQEKQASHGFWNNLLGLATQFILPMVLPGIGSSLGLVGKGGSKLFNWLINDALGKAVTSLGSKALVKGIGTSMYKPGEYESPTAFGKKTFEDIEQSGIDYKSESYMGGGTELLTDLIMSQLPNPFAKGQKMGSLSEQVGLKPFEFGGWENPSLTPYVNKTGVPLDVPIRPKVPMPADTPEMIGNIIPMRPKIPMPFDTPDMLGNFGTSGFPAVEMGAYGQQAPTNYLQKLLNLLPKKGRDLSKSTFSPYE